VRINLFDITLSFTLSHSFLVPLQFTSFRYGNTSAPPASWNSAVSRVPPMS
jgi:hypothetical protein